MIKNSTHACRTLHHTVCLFFILIVSLIIHLICINHAKLLVEEAYYWNYSQHLDWSYLDHPPMVALLIKVSTTIFGTTEFGVRSASLFCWCLSAFFSYQLCELIKPKSGPYALVLLATLPFFFIQSIIITPDVPLITCWSACLYYLYRSLVLKQASTWYWTGLWLGLGMLSKYTICLVALATLCYVLTQKEARFWLQKKQPYLAAIISLLLFTPVIYWNAHHEWISFIFQSSRRFNSLTSVSTHHLLGAVLLFITPLGVFSLWGLIEKKGGSANECSKSKKFLRYFTFVPLSFFALYSVNHEVNFNWSGPLFLAFIPWIASVMSTEPLKKRLWLSVCLSLLVLYSGMILFINYNQSTLIQKKLLLKIIAWDDLIKKINRVATDTEQKNHVPIVLVPLDNYPISSELAFYQTKLLAEGLISTSYPTVGAHIFNRESLMYRYWSKKDDLSGALLILLSKELWRFDDPQVSEHVTPESQLNTVWSTGQGQNLKNIPYYYQIVRLKE